MYDEAERAKARGADPTRGQRLPGVRNLYVAEVLSGAGDGIFWVALIASLADEPHFAAILVVAVLARLGPRALLSVRTGAMLDRADVRSVLIVIDLMRAVLMLALAAVVGAGGAPSLMLVVVLASYTVGVPTRPGLTVALAYLAGEHGSPWPTRLSAASVR